MADATPEMLDAMPPPPGRHRGDGAGVFLFARALAASAGIGRLESLGTHALGIYVTHVLFFWALDVASSDAKLAALLWPAPLAFACALLLTAARRQLPYLRRTLA